jgi:hypothetical protein
VPTDSKALEHLSRDELIAKATALGAIRPELLTRPELRDEIIRLSSGDGAETSHARGWFGVARDLVASVVSQGLNLPDTADLIRGVNVKVPKAGPPVATVTLAEIYAAQGHVSKAITLLDEVLAKEPDHEAARLARQRYAPVAAHAVPTMPPEPEEELVEPGSIQDEKGAFQVEPTELPLNSEVISKKSLGADVTTHEGRLPGVPQGGASFGEVPQGEVPKFSPNEAVTESSVTELAVTETADARPGAVVKESSVMEPAETHSGAVITEPVVTESSVTEPAVEEPRIQSVPVDESTVSAAPSGGTPGTRPGATVTEATPGSQSSVQGRERAGINSNESAAGNVTRNLEEPEEDLLFFVRRAKEQNELIWQLGKRSKKRFDESSDPRRLVVKVLEVEATWDGPKSRESIIELRDSQGQLTLTDVKAAVRFVLGRQDNGRFVPLCLGAEFSWDRQSGAKLLWSPPVTRSSEAWERLGQVRLGSLFVSAGA